MDSVAEGGGANCMGADAAGAVQDRARPGPGFVPDQAVEHGGLALYQRPPVGEEEEVVIGQIVVERAHRVAHTGILPAVPLRRAERRASFGAPAWHGTAGWG